MTSKAQRRGQVRKTRRHRAARRGATRPIQEAYNDMMRDQGHPGWTGEAHNPSDDDAFDADTVKYEDPLDFGQSVLTRHPFWED